MLRDYVTDEQFEEFVNRPENQNRLFERIDGRIVEKMASNPRASQVAARFVRYMGLFVEDEHDLGHVTGADGGFKVAGEEYIPDAAFISKDKQASLVRRGYNPYPPDIAVEVISADIERRSDRKKEIEDLLIKLTNYLSEGVEVWIVDLDRETVSQHRPGQKAMTFGRAETLTTSVLPGFALELERIFR
jgi:Uma2 family endonuclease